MNTFQFLSILFVVFWCGITLDIHLNRIEKKIDAGNTGKSSIDSALAGIAGKAHKERG